MTVLCIGHILSTVQLCEFWYTQDAHSAKTREKEPFDDSCAVVETFTFCVNQTSQAVMYNTMLLTLCINPSSTVQYDAADFMYKSKLYCTIRGC